MIEGLEQKLNTIGEKVLDATRQEICLSMRYLDIAVYSFLDRQMEQIQKLGTDGKYVYYNLPYICNQYRENRALLNRTFLHMVLHCLFLHPFRKIGKRKKGDYYLACDIAVESIIDELPYESIKKEGIEQRRQVYEKLREKMPVLTAEAIYEHILEISRTKKDLDTLLEMFEMDDHIFWRNEDEDKENPQYIQNEREWQEKSRKIQTDLETFSSGGGQGSEGICEALQVENEEKTVYRDFLKKFVVMREEMQLDMDAFDYAFYTLGLDLYGNMPLIEPLETKEVQKIHDFVIAIDTSLSCSKELVKKFLQETYSILKDEESFFKKMNLCLVQCDDKIQKSDFIHNEEELEEYMEHLEIKGMGGTDFRPVFSHINELVEQKKLTQLKGMIYFTDGYGIYPKQCPKYQTAFVFLNDNYEKGKVPAWAIQVKARLEEERH